MLYTILEQPLLNSLVFLYKILFSNLGLAIVVLTVVIRFLLVPLMNPQLKSAKEMQKLAPEIDRLKKKFGTDKQKFMQAQMALYKEHKINPAAGCLPQIIQIVLLYSLYKVFNQVIQSSGSDLITKINDGLYQFNKLPTATSSFNLNFLYLNLGKPDVIHIPGLFPLPGLFVIGATVFQFLSSKMMMPAAKKEIVIAEKTPQKTDDMASSMQKQMLYMFPAMTLIFGFTMPSGVIIYWFIFSLFSYVQQLIINRAKNGGNAK